MGLERRGDSNIDMAKLLRAASLDSTQNTTIIAGSLAIPEVRSAPLVLVIGLGVLATLECLVAFGTNRFSKRFEKRALELNPNILPIKRLFNQTPKPALK